VAETVCARADSGFYCWEAVESYEQHGGQFIIAAGPKGYVPVLAVPLRC
jgi:hypothetical protein